MRFQGSVSADGAGEVAVLAGDDGGVAINELTRLLPRPLTCIYGCLSR